MSRAGVILLAAACSAACTSPESTRTRGGGPGADVGNRGEVVLMHEGAKPFAGTPQLSGVAAPPLESAAQAHAMSTEAR